MKTVFRLTIASVALAIAFIAFPARSFAATTPQEMHISCTAPNPDHQTGLHRPKGDGNAWTFQIVLDGDARFVDGPYWTYPGKSGTDPDWGLWMGGDDGDSSLGWSSPGKTGEFQVSVKGKITCGDGGGGGGEPIDFSAGWDGKVEFNAEIKVRRKDSGDDYSSSATVAAGGKSTSEHQADVEVIATDDNGNPMSDISVEAPTIQDEDEYVNKKANISPSSATTDSEGKTFFTFTSSDIVKSVTIEEDGGESSATATVSQDWTHIPNKKKSEDQDHYSWDFKNSFIYGDTSDVIFVMSLNDTSPGRAGSIPITKHVSMESDNNLKFVVAKVDGYEWNPQTEKYDHVVNQNYQRVADKYGNLVTFSQATEPSPGKYSADLVVKQNGDFWVDVVYFKVIDWNVFE